MISVLGATGYTGQLIVRELHRRGVRCLAAGRNPDKLRRLAADIGSIDTLFADAAEPTSLERLAQRCSVIINCAGPFVDHGEPVVRAAIAGGAHYLDTTGEQPFMKAMLVHDEWARHEQVAVVSAQAFEVAVADCAAALAADGFSDIAAVHVTYVTTFHASQGTQRTIVRMLQSRGYAYLAGQCVEEPPGVMRKSVAFPAPLGSVTGVSFPSAEVITIPRHVTTREVRTFMGLSGGTAAVMSAVAPAARWLMHTPLASLASRLIGSGTGGPDATTRAADAFHIAIEVRGVRNGHATTRQMFVHGHDPYGLTAVIAAYGALLMCRPSYDRAGALAPAAAFDPRDLLEHLKQFGVGWEIS